MQLGSLPILDRKQRSITQALSPLYRKNNGIKHHNTEENVKNQLKLESIYNQYSNLTNAMDNLQTNLHKRMGYHEIQLLQIMKSQIKRMLQDVKNVVKQYNNMIKQKNFSQDLWETKNEVQYFKYEAFKLFQQNKTLRKENSQLKKQIQQLTFSEQCQKFALQKMAKKLAKKKAQYNSLSANHFDLRLKNKIQNQKRFQTRNIRVQNQEDKNQQIPQRKRNGSLYSCIAKISQNALSTTPRADEQKKNQSFIESTIPHTDQRKVFKTQMQNSQSDLRQDKIPSHSGRINLFLIPGRTQKLKKIKQRSSFNKNIANLTNNELNKIQL